jgi:hypothetical protein
MDNETKNEARKILPFSMKNGYQLATTAPPNIPSLVSGLLIQVGCSIVSGDPKLGKSSFARQLMVDIAEDRDFLDFPTIGGDCLYLYLEGPLGVVQQHFQKLGHTGERGQIHVIDENMAGGADFSLRRLSDSIKSLPNLRLIVVDPLSKFLCLKDSTSTDEVVPAMALLEKFAKEHSLHVMALMHEKKRKSEQDTFHNQLGSVGFRGGSDTNVSLTRQGKQRIISSEQRWGVGLEPTVLNFDEVRLVNSLGKTVEAVEEENRGGKERKTLQRIEQQILDALLVKALATNEILDAVTGKSSTILDVLEQMVSNGRVVAEQDGKTKRYRAVEIQNEVMKEAA